MWDHLSMVNVRWIVGLVLQVVACLVAITAVVALSSNIGPFEFLLLAALAVGLALAGQRFRSSSSRPRPEPAL